MKTDIETNFIMKKKFHIYAVITGQDVSFIGCTRGEIPAGAIRLQTVCDHPEANWVKWCVRFRHTLKDRRGVEHPLAEFFTNPCRLKRLLDADADTRLEAQKCREFLAFHSRNPHVLEDMIKKAREEQTAVAQFTRSKPISQMCVVTLTWIRTKRVTPSK
jgi:hypothetical protein